MKYLRKKADGWVYDWNPELVKRADMEEFECQSAPPQQIENLTDFLVSQSESAKPTARRSKKQEEPQESE